MPILRTLALTLLAVSEPAFAADDAQLSLLFLGDNGHHRPADRAAQLIPALAQRGIDVRYTDDVNVLAADTLAQFDGLIIYANIESITTEQEQALLDYVADGHGFIPLHCASYCFLNSPKYIELVGAQFQRHGGQVFRTAIAEPQHPLMLGFGGFASWDETYIHRLHNEEGRTVLEYREEGEQAEGKQREPWTWVRTHGKGRVFYTAWGHDERTFGHPGFQNLVERGIRWACGDDPSVVPAYRERSPFVPPQMTELPTDVAPFEYIDVGNKIPVYTAGEKWGTQEANRSDMQLPLPPEESVKHFVVPEGFELHVYASDPELGGKPVAMAWDERGRLWVCETYDYPNELQPPGQGRDRIRICDDTDGDGRADKFTVFAEQLSIPTSIAFAYGGAIVQDATRTLYLKDTDGDDVADVRETLITGWTLGDTHGGVSNFQYGLDNWIYGMQGYNDSQPVINGERQQRFRQGFFRFRLDPPADESSAPRVAEIEFLRSTDNNTWGIGFSEEGILFGSTANHNPSVYMPIPNRYYERVRGWAPEQLGTIADSHLFRPITEKVRQMDHHGGYTAGAGHALYTARAYPEQWWNRTAFVCGPTGHLVGTFVLTPDGSDFHSTSPCNLVASDDEWSAPIMAEVGPDGNVWILDWYNYIVQHNPTPQGFETGRGNAYETDLRDKKHGRIYRLVFAGDRNRSDLIESAELPNRLKFDPSARHGGLHGLALGQVVDSLRHPTMLWRKQAQRVLIEQSSSADLPVLTAALIDLIEDESVDAIGLNVGAIHALWTLHGLNIINEEHPEVIAAVHDALSHPSAGVRRNAVQVLPGSAASLEAITAAGLAHDADPQVRLAWLLALSDLPDVDGIGVSVTEPALDPALLRDRWLRDAATSAASVHALPFFEQLAEADQLPAADSLTWPIVRRAAEHVARSRPESEDIDRIVPLLAAADPLVVENILAGLASGWPRNYEIELSEAADQGLLNLLDGLPSSGQAQLIRLAGLWGAKGLDAHLEQIAGALLAAVHEESSQIDERLQAARQLVALQPLSEGVVNDLLSLVTPQAPVDLATGLINAVAMSNSDSVGPALIERSQSLTPTLRDAVTRALLSRPDTTTAFLDAVEAGEASLADLKLDQQQALSTHPDGKIRERALALLKAGVGLPNPDRQKVLDELMPVTELAGDPDLGREIYKKQCSKCHVHGTEGTRIGPDLTGMAVHPKAELLLNIIDPSRSVEGNFRIFTVLTVDGLVINGMLASETRTTLELIDTEAKRHIVQRDEIEELQASTKSLMPEGFEKQMTPEEISNLLAFLAQRGRYLPIPLDKAATVVTTRGMFFNANGDIERLVFPDWGPKEFNGVPFILVDPQGDRRANAVMLHGELGDTPPRMPKSVTLPCNAPAVAIHFLSGVGGWNYPAIRDESVTMIVRLHYADGHTEDHELLNGVHFADYIRRVDVPGSEFAFPLRGQQIRYFAIQPDRTELIKEIELVKGNDATAPVVMAVTVETRSANEPDAE